MGAAPAQRPPTRDGRGRASRAAPPSRRADARATSGCGSTRLATSSSCLRDDFVAIDGFDEGMVLGWHVDSNLSRRHAPPPRLDREPRGRRRRLPLQPQPDANRLPRRPNRSGTTSTVSSWRSSAPTSPTSARPGGSPTSTLEEVSVGSSGGSPLHRRARSPRSRACAAWQIPVEPVRGGVRAHLRLGSRAAAHRRLDRGLGSARSRSATSGPTRCSAT